MILQHLLEQKDKASVLRAFIPYHLRSAPFSLSNFASVIRDSTAVLMTEALSSAPVNMPVQSATAQNR
jgi:hypothetical protein